MTHYLDPKADVVFKKIFGEHPHLLKSFLNALLPLPDDSPIVTLEYLSPENAPIIPGMKKTIADVKCTDSQGRVFIVEMQIDWIDSFKQRLLYESGQALVKQLRHGEDYRLIRPVYGLALIATNFDKSSQWYHHYQLVNQDKIPRDIIEHLQLVFIELKKFPIHSPEEKQLRLLWLRFMREINEQTREVSDELKAVPEIKEALHLSEESAYNEGELFAYEAYWKAISTEKSLFQGYYRKGKEEGKEEGLQQERLAIARNMLNHQMNDALILQITGLSQTELAILKK